PSRSPAFVSSSCTFDANRFSPDRCGTVSSSTTSADPQGVAVFAMKTTVRQKASQVCDAFVPKLRKVLRAQPISHGSTYRSSIRHLLPLPIGVIWTRADVEPRSGIRMFPPPPESSRPWAAQGPPGAYVVASVIPSTTFSRPYQTTRTRRPESVPPTSEPNMRMYTSFGPRQRTGLAALLPLGSDSECVPVASTVWLP